MFIGQYRQVYSKHVYYYLKKHYIYIIASVAFVNMSVLHHLPYVFFMVLLLTKVIHFSQLFHPGVVPHILGLEFAAAEVRRARHAWRAALLP